MSTTQTAKKPKKEVPPRFSSREGTVADFISDGFAEITSVGEEFREIYDNAPEGLKNSSVNEARDNTASTIEGFSEPDVSSSILSELSCSTQIDNGKMYRGRQSQSRACRANNGASMLRAAADALDNWLGENSEVRVEEDADQEGKWVYFIGDDGSDTSYDTEEDAKAALEQEIGHDMDDHNQAVEEADGLRDECNEIADEIEGLEFPGMFG